MFTYPVRLWSHLPDRLMTDADHRATMTHRQRARRDMTSITPAGNQTFMSLLLVFIQLALTSSIMTLTDLRGWKVEFWRSCRRDKTESSLRVKKKSLSGIFLQDWSAGNTEASSQRGTAGHDHRVNLYDLWPCELTTGPQRQHPKTFTGHETESRRNEGLSGEFWYLHVKNGSRGQRRCFAVSAVLITNSQCLLRVHSLQLIAVHQHCQHRPALYPPPTLLHIRPHFHKMLQTFRH